MPRVSINIVTWNSSKFIRQCLNSIFEQNYKDFSVLIIDNASTDGTAKIIEKEFPQVSVLKNARNLGFSKAHNQGIRFAIEKGFEYVLVFNPDIIITDNCMGELVQAAETDSGVASVGPKLFKIQTTNTELKESLKTKVIDSCGLKILKSRKIVERGAGEKDSGQYDNKEEVFGLSGAMVLYRSEALKDIKIFNEYFDEKFFAYKEDVDLAWRLRLRGWKNLYQGKAIAYHYRGASIEEKAGIMKIIKNRRGKSKMINHYSYKNHLLLLVKNDFAFNLILNFPFIFTYELKKFIYILFFESRTLKSFLQFLKEFPSAVKKRRLIMRSRKIGPKEIKKWFK